MSRTERPWEDPRQTAQGRTYRNAAHRRQSEALDREAVTYKRTYAIWQASEKNLSLVEARAIALRELEELQ